MSTLTIKEYQKLAKRTCPSLGSLELDLEHMELGIITECGEVLDIFKKNLAYKKPIDFVNLGEEIADISWYLVNKATFQNIEITEVISESYKEVYSLPSTTFFKHLSISLDDEEYSIVTALEYLKGIAEEHGLVYEEMLFRNIAKLKVRYPEKFDENLALNRNLDEERKTLEA